MSELFDRIFANIPIPELDLGNRVGLTSYIDFIKVKDMSAPVMKGIDIYRRQFYAIKITLNDENNSQLVGTFFQRYTDDYDNWAYGTCYAEGFYIYCDSRIRTNHYEWLEKRLNLLLQGTILNNIDLYTDCDDNEIDYINGNGSVQISLAK